MVRLFFSSGIGGSYCGIFASIDFNGASLRADACWGGGGIGIGVCAMSVAQLRDLSIIESLFKFGK